MDDDDPRSKIMNRPASQKWKQKTPILCCKLIRQEQSQQAGEGSQEDNLSFLDHADMDTMPATCTGMQSSGCSQCSLRPCQQMQLSMRNTARVDAGIIDLEEICSHGISGMENDIIAPEPPVPHPEVISRRVSSGKQSGAPTVIRRLSSGKQSDVDADERKEWKRIAHAPSLAAKFAATVDMTATPEDIQRQILCRQERRKIKSGAVYFTMCEVKRHASRNSCWCVAGKNVYDVTRFLDMHPAGAETIMGNAGGVDCTRDFHFHSPAAREMINQFYIGMLRKCPICEPGDQCLLS